MPKYPFQYNQISEGSPGAYLLDVLCGEFGEVWDWWRPPALYWEEILEEGRN